jgi:cellulose synthase operon protein YhjQ
MARNERAVNPVNEVTSNLIELPRPAHRAPQPEPSPPAAAESPRAHRNRWSAIQDAFSPDPLTQPAGVAAHTLPPGSISIFGVGGGVGKTTIAANLARVLTGAGESVLLAGLSPDSILPLYFGARSVPGSGLRSFLLPGNPGRGSLHLYLDSPARNDDQEGKDVLDRLCAQADVAQGDLNRAILVFPAGAPAPLLSVLRNTSISLAIVVPDLVCAIGVGKLLRFFRGCQDQLVAPYFLINKFDSARPLHQEMRNRLHEQLGARLLPLVIRRSDDVEDAPLAGMTVIDYAPATNVAQDFEQLADWVVSHTSRANGGR